MSASPPEIRFALSESTCTDSVPAACAPPVPATTQRRHDRGGEQRLRSHQASSSLFSAHPRTGREAGRKRPHLTPSMTKRVLPGAPGGKRRSAHQRQGHRESRVGQLISATGTARPAERRSVAIRRPGCTAGRTEPAISPSPATVRSRSSMRSARPQKNAGRFAPPARPSTSSGSWTTSRITSPRRKNAWRGAPAGVGSSRRRRRSRPAACERPHAAVEVG